VEREVEGGVEEEEEREVKDNKEGAGLEEGGDLDLDGLTAGLVIGSVLGSGFEGNLKLSLLMEEWGLVIE
jgi:hypothetical protein